MTDDAAGDPRVKERTDDPVRSVKADIEATRAELQETVNELSDRLNPKTQAHHAVESLAETTKRTATEAGSAAKHGAGQAKSVAQRQIGRAQHAGRDRQFGALALAAAAAGLVWWRRGRR
jgi:Protein of unknown function (DUF3618)